MIQLIKKLGSNLLIDLAILPLAIWRVPMILESFTSEEAKLYYGIGSFFGLISPVVFAIGGSRFSLMYHKDDFNSKSYLDI